MRERYLVRLWRRSRAAPVDLTGPLADRPICRLGVALGVTTATQKS